MPTSAPPNLDPEDWQAFRAASRRALDDMIDFLQTVRARPVWQQAPAEVVREFRQPLPAAPQSLDEVLADFSSLVRPYATGNLHPLFMGWVHGAGTPVGMIAEMLAAGLNANCGGRNHIALDVERQIAAWAAQLFELPPDASGLFVTGTSAANHLALLVARNAALGDDVRAAGLHDAGPQLVAYTSAEAHGCIKQAMEMAGIGSRFLRLIPVDHRGAMRADCLAVAIAADRAGGLRPFMVAGTAGTVNSGAFDDLEALAEICRREKLWFHVDGAFGALVALSSSLRPLVRGIARADSIAFDFHKWAHVPYDAGFLLVRDGERHRDAFAQPAAYLRRETRGLAAGTQWPCDLGVDLSRGFRALKTWFTLKTFGTERLGAMIARTCALASYLEARILAEPRLELLAPVNLNIVCFRYRADDVNAVNGEIVADIHEAGIAAPSTTMLDGQLAIRAAIVNHRTERSDVDALLRAVLLFGGQRTALGTTPLIEAEAPPLAPSTLG